MQHTSLKKILSLTLVLLFSMGCALGAKPAATPPTNTNEPPAQPTSTTESPTTTPVEQTGACANKYYPVREGATWSYKSTGSIAGDYSFLDTITTVRDNGFTLTSQFSKLTRTQ